MDSPQKRRSAVGVGELTVAPYLPEGALSTAAQRRQVAFGYAGTATAPPTLRFRVRTSGAGLRFAPRTGSVFRFRPRP